MKDFFQNLKNTIDFSLRQKVGFSRKNYFLPNEGKGEPSEKEKILVEKYQLQDLRNSSSLQNYLENLYTIDLLDKYLKIAFTPELKVLDVGCKNWFYAKGEYLFFKKYCKNLSLKGIEIDSNRLDTNLYSRKEIAKYHIKNLDSANYIEGNFLRHNEKYDYIIWFLPFVFERPHLKWGLPMKHFKPEKMLKHAVDSLNPNGQIFIVNQGDNEFGEQKMLCKKLNLEFDQIGKIESEFLKYNHDRYLTIVKMK